MFEAIHKQNERNKIFFCQAFGKSKPEWRRELDNFLQFLNFQHQRYISPYFLLSKMNSLWIFISSNHSVALNPPQFSILPKDIASHNIPLSLFYIKISLFTGSFLLSFKHSLISSLKIGKENLFITFILMSYHFSLQ